MLQSARVEAESRAGGKRFNLSQPCRGWHPHVYSETTNMVHLGECPVRPCSLPRRYNVYGLHSALLCVFAASSGDLRYCVRGPEMGWRVEGGRIRLALTCSSHILSLTSRRLSSHSPP